MQDSSMETVQVTPLSRTPASFP